MESSALFARSQGTTSSILSKQRGKNEMHSKLRTRYWLAILRGEFVQYTEDENMGLMKQTDLAWPHAFTRFSCSADEFIATYSSNHIHAVYGDWVKELLTVAELLGIEARVYGEK